MKIPASSLALLGCVLPPACASVLDARQAGNIVEAITKLPGCATPCVISAARNSSCALTDAGCLCQDEHFEAITEACIVSSCNVTDTLYSKNLFEMTCDRPVRDNGAEYARVTWAMIGLSTAIVTARLIYKYCSTVPLGIDDLFALLAFLGVLPSFIINIVGLVPSGIGRDIWTLTPEQITEFSFWFYVLEPMYFVQLGLVKMAVLAFFIRIFNTSSLRPYLWGTAAFNAVNTVAFVFAAVFQCSPISYNWNRWDGAHEGSCVNINALVWASAAISIALDLWMLGVPLFQLHTLKLHLAKKIAAGIMFCVGTFVTVISILRLHSLVLFATSNNPTWDQYGLALWTTIEIPVGIVCCCLPAIRQILIKVIPSRFNRLTHYYAKHSPAASADQAGSSKRGSRNHLSRASRADNVAAPRASVAPARQSRHPPDLWDSISEVDDTSQLYRLNDLEGVATDDKEGSLPDPDPLTPTSSVLRQSTENR